jgi:hypothetical protein
MIDTRFRASVGRTLATRPKPVRECVETVLDHLAVASHTPSGANGMRIMNWLGVKRCALVT